MNLQKTLPARKILSTGAAYWFSGLMAAMIFQTGCSGPGDTPLFEEVTLGSGLEAYTGMTYGAAWGDVDSDGLPDLYVTNHLNNAQLFRNQGHGRFADVTPEFFKPENLTGDKHGAAWADFNNDGRLDLVQLTGASMGVGSELKRLFLNRGTKFEEIAESVGVSNPYGRTRMPLWIDLDRNGHLDIFHGAEARFDDRSPPFIFLQQDDVFIESKEMVKFASLSVPFCILTELNNEPHSELLCRVAGKNRTAEIFDTSTLPARELDLLPVTAFEDIAAGDFDNDGLIDLYLARKNPPGTVALGQLGSNEIIADVSLNPDSIGKPAGVSFRSSGRLTVRVASMLPKNGLSVGDIYIGQEGRHPSDFTFDLSSETAGIDGLVAYHPGAQAGVYIGLTAPDQWEVHIAGSRQGLADKGSRHQQVAVKIRSSEAITELAAIGDSTQPEEAPDRLFMNRDGKLVQEGDERGVHEQDIASVNAVAGDFDNDMDLDLFVVGSGDVGKQGNRLLLNEGDGYFDVVSSAGGAAGPRTGVGDSVTTVDFDNDGFLDLLVTTGGSMGRSLGLPSEEGGYYLYRNIGNGNHWLQIDLEGTASNRDGIGARVQVTTGGVTQTRIRDGGIHHRGQNHSRLHFGLGKNDRVDEIRVEWPGGMIQEMRDIQVDQIIRIKEPASSS